MQLKHLQLYLIKVNLLHQLLNDILFSVANRVLFIVSVYLRTSPDVCMKRIQKRNRSEESTVSMDLLDSLHERYEDWLLRKTKFYLPAPVVVVDGNQSLEELFQYYEKNTHSLLGMKQTPLINVPTS